MHIKFEAGLPKPEAKKILSQMFDVILKITAVNTHTDGSYETKDFQIEDFCTELQTLWVELVAEIDRQCCKKAEVEIARLKAALNKAGEMICDRCVDTTCPSEGPCNETNFIKEALEG